MYIITTLRDINIQFKRSCYCCLVSIQNEAAVLLIDELTVFTRCLASVRCIHDVLNNLLDEDTSNSDYKYERSATSDCCLVNRLSVDGHPDWCAEENI